MHENLEEQTMNMATAAENLILPNLCYQDGTSIQCIVFDTTSSGGTEAARCAVAMILTILVTNTAPCFHDVRT